MASLWGLKHLGTLNVIFLYKYLMKSTVRFVGLSAVNRLPKMHWMDNVKKEALRRTRCRGENNIKIGVQFMVCQGTDWIGLAQDRGKVTRFCERCNKLSRLTKRGKYLGWFRKHAISRKDSAPLGQLVS
jgi:hypothetical protein